MSRRSDETESSSEGSANVLWYTFKYGGGLAIATAVWLYVITLDVDGVYLDEEFHVRQALVYVDHRFSVWDPKITTPPGLYVVGYAWLFALKSLHIPGSPLTHLRSLNAVGLFALWLAAWSVSDAIQADREPKLKQQDSKAGEKSDSLTVAKKRLDKRRQTSAHVALNVAIFPPLFFFSGLFYTDVLSALFVLLAHRAHYERQPFALFIASLSSLFFRQTNILWTAIYLAGLEAQRQIVRLDAARHGKRKHLNASSWTDVVQSSWKDGALYDPPAPAASLEDYLKSGLSLGLAAMSNLPSLILPLSPHLLLLGLFCTFLVVNGGVVLGDKSNHVASIHIPQLLYIWPCFAFFSFLVLLPGVFLTIAATIKKYHPSMSRDQTWKVPSAHRLPRPLLLVVFTLLALAAVYLNTIVHPFILADNRHYTFYVFKLLLRHPLIRFAVTPIYVFCGWLCLSVGLTGFEAREKTGTASTKTSVMLIWLLASAGSLATAPLVEPRYFIMPWIIWRLNAHIPPVDDSEDWDGNETMLANIERELLGYESNWLVIINLTVVYVFLFWHFEWPQQPGTIMRFMW